MARSRIARSAWRWLTRSAGHGKGTGSARRERLQTDMLEAALSDLTKNPNDKEALDRIADGLGQNKSDLSKAL